MMNIGVLVSGGGTNLQAIIDAIDNGKIQDAAIVTVVSDRPAYALERAKNHGIEAICFDRKLYNLAELNSKICQHMKSRAADLVVMAGFLSIVDSNFVHEFAGRIINIHPSLIPSFCGPGFYGLKVHEAVLRRGVKVTGATAHYVNEIPDGGPIIAQKAVNVEDGDTPEILQARVMREAEWVILPEAIAQIAENFNSK
jgi:phosphoribosylglycinamide formyltransferase-1